jgi:hypothetical protein
MIYRNNNSGSVVRFWHTYCDGLAAMEGAAGVTEAIPHTATAFYECFEPVFGSVCTDLPHIDRLAGRVPRWRSLLPNGSLSFAFATSARAATMWPQMPGEFRLLINWSRDLENVFGGEEVSLFQYTSDADVFEYAAHQRRALRKFLDHAGNANRRELFPYTADANWLPRPTDDEWCYYFDVEDVREWAEWYRRVLPEWIDRFAAMPESRLGWTRRVWSARRRALIVPSDQR